MKDGEPSREVLRVTHRTKLIDGVRCTVLEDRLYLSGALEERTTDWYAQDEGATSGTSAKRPPSWTSTAG